MQRRVEEAPPPPPRSVAQLDAEQLILDRERAIAVKAERDEQRRRAALEGARVLAPPTPSPKKQARQVADIDLRKGTSFSTRIRQESVSIPQDGMQDDSGPAPIMSKSTLIELALPPSAQTLPESRYLSGLSMVNAKGKEKEVQRTSSRSAGFEQSAKIHYPSLKDAVPTQRAAAVGSRSQTLSKRAKPSPSTIVNASKPASMARHISSALAPSDPVPSTSRREASVAALSENEDDDLDVTDAPTKPKTRNADGTLIERLVLGPVEHRTLVEDPSFKRIEPNSGIRLRSRTLSHPALQDHLTARYHLTPALLYSIVRPSNRGAGDLEVPLVGDFIIIGVLAHKDETRFIRADALKTQAKEVIAPKRWEGVKGADERRTKTGEVDEEREQEEEETDVLYAKQTTKQRQRRYIKFTLVDLSTETAAASGTGTLTLMLFESETSDLVDEGEGKKRGNYRGGSGGAYEKWWKESAGAVVAILNPKVMKQKVVTGMSGSNTLSITPESADSMILIGRAQDLSSCRAITLGGKACGQWCDVRVNSICSYHLATKVKSNAASRPETYSSNASHAATVSFNAKTFAAALKPSASRPVRGGQAPYDPINKVGLLPRDNSRMIDGAMTYVTTGTATFGGKRAVKGPSVNGLRAAAIQSGNGSGGYVAGFRDGPTVEEAKKARRDQRKAKEDRDWEMKQLLHKTKDDTSLGGQYLKMEATRKKNKAREAAAKEAFLEGAQGGSKKKRARVELESESEEEEKGDKDKKRTRPFSTTALRLIGYDPTSNGDTGREEDDLSKKKRLDAIAFLSSNVDRATPNLRAPKGKKIRSGVVVPMAPATILDEGGEDLLDLRVGQGPAPANRDDELAVGSHPAAA